MLPDNCYVKKGVEPTFLLFFTVTRLTPVMGFIPSFSIALRLFFSLRLCFDLPVASPSCPAFVNKKNEIKNIVAE